MSNATPHRIDVHHHIVPPRYLADVGVDRVFRQALPPLKKQVMAWTPEKSIEEMDRNGIATAFASVSAPGVWFDDVPFSRGIARMCNDYGAQLVRDHPGRFGLFASLPLPDIDGSLREIDYALDTLAADGFVLMTSYGDRWPGDAAFAPLFDVLNRRKAVVFIHPTVPNCCVNLIAGVPDAAIEFMFDTVRAVVSLMMSGTLARYPDIRYIFCHAGSAVPLLASRITRAVAAHPNAASLAPAGPMHELRKLYYELAQSGSREALTPLMQLVPVGQVMLGSDFPWTGWKLADTICAVAKHGFSPDEIAAIERDNAVRLFPRLA